jgi:hypothetical protein
MLAGQGSVPSIELSGSYIHSFGGWPSAVSDTWPQDACSCMKHRTEMAKSSRQKCRIVRLE